MRKIIIILVVLILSGCATQPNPVLPQAYSQRIDVSQNIKSVGIGDRVFEEGEYLIYETLHLKEDFESQFGPSWDHQKISIPAQQLIASGEDEKFTYYYGNNITYNTASFGIRTPTRYISGGFKVRKDATDKEKNNLQVFVGLLRDTFYKGEEPIVEKSQIKKRAKSGFQKELIYGGRQGGFLIFKYYKRDNTRVKKDIERDFKFDPSEKILSVDDVKIEIISHSSINLKYRFLN